MTYQANLFGWRDCPLNNAQIAARRRIAEAHGAEFDVMNKGKTAYSLPMDDLGDTVRLTRVREAIKAADLALNDGAPPAKW